MRATVLVICLACAAPAAAADLSGWYARAEGGQAVTVPWLGARVGRDLDGGPALDLGVGGVFEGRGFLSVTGGVEARALTAHRVSIFTRAEAGLLATSARSAYGVLSLGGGVDVRVSREWSVRMGLMRSLNVSDSLLGPDYVFLGMERRW